MTNKMTDEEIEKALERCKSEDLPCQECAYWHIATQGYNCRNALIRDVSDYINRLKADNATLQDENRRVLDWKRRQEDFINKAIDRFDKELMKQKEQVSKDTVKEILQDWYDDVVHGMGVDGCYIKEYAKKYGVEMDNE